MSLAYGMEAIIFLCMSHYICKVLSISAIYYLLTKAPLIVPLASALPFLPLRSVTPWQLSFLGKYSSSTCLSPWSLHPRPLFISIASSEEVFSTSRVLILLICWRPSNLPLWHWSAHWTSYPTSFITGTPNRYLSFTVSKMKPACLL